jgi:hypothetical protein
MRKLLSLGAILALVISQTLSGQTHHWPLTENLNDVVGTLHGTNHGVTFGNDAVRGPVAIFEGESAYANLPSFVNGNEAITVTCWWKMDESRVWSRIYTFGKGDQVEPKDVMMVIPVSGNDNMYRFTLSDPAGPWVDADFPKEVVDVTTGVWYWSAVVLKPDSIILYHNDTQIFAESGFARPISTLADNENAIGKSFWPDKLWKGALSDLRFYNKSLSNAEILELYNATNPVGISKNKVNSDTPVIYSALNKINVTLNNPNNDEVVTVYNVTGALLARKSIREISNITFNAGIYVVKVNGANVNYVAKVLVK